MPYAWDGDTQTYRDSQSGDEIDPEEILDEIIDEYGEDLDLLAEELEAEELNKVTKEHLKGLYIILALLALGGALTYLVRIELEKRLSRQFTYLDQFTRAITQRNLSVLEIQRRLRMYTNSARQAYWVARKSVARDLGYTEERWLPIGDIATCSPCVEAGQMEWQSLGTFGEPGSGQVMVSPPSECNGLTFCRCRKEYR